MRTDMIAINHKTCGGVAWWQTPDSVRDEFLCAEDVEYVSGEQPRPDDIIRCGYCGALLHNGPHALEVSASRLVSPTPPE